LLGAKASFSPKFIFVLPKVGNSGNDTQRRGLTGARQVLSRATGWRWRVLFA